MNTANFWKLSHVWGVSYMLVNQCRSEGRCKKGHHVCMRDMNMANSVFAVALDGRHACVAVGSKLLWSIVTDGRTSWNGMLVGPILRFLRRILVKVLPAALPTAPVSLGDENKKEGRHKCRLGRAIALTIVIATYRICEKSRPARPKPGFLLPQPQSHQCLAPSWESPPAVAASPHRGCVQSPAVRRGVARSSR